MGMYTELIFGASLKKLPDYVVEALDYTINDKENVSQEALDFAEQYDLGLIFLGSSYYFGAHRNKPTFVYDNPGEHWVLSTRANCKNYQNQIEKFIEFITPYVESGSGPNDIFAYVQYEEAEFPTLYGKYGRYDMNDPDRVYAAEDKLNKINDVLWPALNNMIKEYVITEDVLAENGLDIKTFNTCDTIVLCIKELERRWNQTYDTNYKEMQKALETTKSALFEMSCDVTYLEDQLRKYKEKFGEL